MTGIKSFLLFTKQMGESLKGCKGSTDDMNLTPSHAILTSAQNILFTRMQSVQVKCTDY